MSLLSTRLARALAASFVVIAVVAACGSEGGSSFEDPNRIDSGGGGSNGASGNIIGRGDDGGVGGDGDGGNAIDPNCKALTCADQNLGCGLAGDGCGRQIDCGGCADNERCGGAGKPSQCVTIEAATSCTPKTCAEVNVSCGTAGDGCGNVINCGTCAADEQCGALGRPSQCVKIEATQPDGGACVPKVRADFLADNKDCGTQSDGCGGTIDLGGCIAPQFCGGGGPSKCAVSGGGVCTKKTCADYPANICGRQPDGCGGVTTTECGTACRLPEVCGGGGIPSQCGGGTLTDDGGNACVPRTCAAGQCGTISDGCGGVVNCGNAACTNGTFCGGGGTPNQCGEPACTPLTQAAACSGGRNCGVVGDGCGGTITCGPATCATAGQLCGANNRPNVCGGGTVTADGGPGGGTCVPITASSPGACPAGRCGPIANGCGGTYVCGTAPSYCPAGSSCGLGGTSTCGPSACVPRTQAEACAGLNCGIVANGCGQSINCWRDVNGNFSAAQTTCPSPGPGPTFSTGNSCGAGGTPNVCGGGVPCTGTYCGTQPTTCAGGSNTTRITGTVFAPNRSLPIHDALVYVPNGTLADVETGVAGCDTCVPPSGAPFVTARTATNGTFTLENVPVPKTAGTARPITLVLQKGRWRKVLQVTPNECGNLALSAVQSSFDTTHYDTAGHVPSNHIPKFAVTTGGADAMQCLLRRIGIGDSEFGNPGSLKPAAEGGLARRVNIFRGATHDNDIPANSRFRYGFNGFNTDATRNFPAETSLYGNSSATQVNTTTLRGYDGVVLTCTGVGDNNGSPYSGYVDDMQSFANGGGKIFASHWHHSWLHRGPAPWPGLASFDDGASQNDDPITEYVNLTAQKGADLADWLQAARGNTGTRGQLTVRASRTTVTDITTAGVNAGGVPLIRKGANNTGAVQYVDYPMPADQPAANKCGRFVLSDLHVTGGSTDSVTNGGTYRVCVGGTRDGQACSSNSFCTGSNNCSSNGGNSGFPGNCSSSLTLSDQEKVLAYMLFDLTSCVDSGPPPTTCTPRTCAAYPGRCGVQSNGCGGLTEYCNPCPGSQTCGGGGTPGVCGTNTCTPTACPANHCSDTGYPNGCGGFSPCNPCPAGQTCGGGGQANRCGNPTCTPRTCAQVATSTFQCGQTGDGCGGTLTCNCPSGQTCGAGNPGRPNICGACQPRTTCPAGLNCGQWPDGCGGVVNCGTCPDGSSCGGGGQANVCGQGSCVAKSCAELGAECGQVADGCGGSTRCPDCAAGSFCNAQNLCVPPTCQPKTCAQLGVECGPAADTCGGLIAGGCGSCPAGTGCGAGGTPGKCEPMACTPLTCQQANAVCGQVANGCGGLTTNCGSCPGSQSCVNGACVNACTPRTCTEAAAECGFVSDGCGGALDCGSCVAGKVCGFNNQANKCGAEGPR